MKTILWVEDEKDQYEAFSYYLEKEYKIDRALDYEDALLKLNKPILIPQFARPSAHFSVCSL